MNYEIIELQQKTVVGLAAKTNNSAADMSKVIGNLWNRFYGGIYESISNKKNDKALGIYTDYEDDEKADYSVVVACEVERADHLPEGTIVRTIPTGKYAKFVVKGNMQTAVADFWQELWTMDLPRAFTCDFEEYQNGDMEHAEIHIYISLNK